MFGVFSWDDIQYDLFGVCGMPSAKDRAIKAQSLLSNSNCQLLFENLKLEEIGVFGPGLQDLNKGTIGVISEEVSYFVFCVLW